jgi:NO-binding membrane sensor protein with MHYT domain
MKAAIAIYMSFFLSVALIPLLSFLAWLIMRRKGATNRSWYIAYGLALLLASALVLIHYYVSLLALLVLIVLITIVKRSGDDSWENRGVVYGLCFLWPVALPLLILVIEGTQIGKLWYLVGAVIFSMPYPLILAMRYSPPPKAP